VAPPSSNSIVGKDPSKPMVKSSRNLVGFPFTSGIPLI